MISNKMQNVGSPFKTIQNAATISGLSQHYLRKGCRDGSVPHIRAGDKYLVNIPALFDQLGVPYEAIKL